jgi:uncharacterized membrane protein YgcG
MLIFLAFFFGGCLQRKSADMPIDHAERVIDKIGLLTNGEKTSLLTLIDSIENALGPQFGVYVADTLNGETIEVVSLKMAQELRLGRTGINDGILITLAPKDNQLRIEVGTGLELIIKDEVAAQIISNEMAPFLREENFYDALLAGIRKLANEINRRKYLIGRGAH